MIQIILQYLVFLSAISFVFWLLLEVTKRIKISFLNFVGFVCFILMIIYCFMSLLYFNDKTRQNKETYKMIIIPADTLYRKN